MFSSLQLMPPDSPVDRRYSDFVTTASIIRIGDDRRVVEVNTRFSGFDFKNQKNAKGATRESWNDEKGDGKMATGRLSSLHLRSCTKPYVR